MTHLAYLPHRGVLAISGADRLGFLQGLVSNDVRLAAPGRAVWSALLTPQGKYVADFFMFADAGRLLLEAEAALLPDLAAKLTRYRLRADVAIAATPLRVHAAWDGPAPALPPDCLAAADPRLPQAGLRVLGAADLPCNAAADDYDRHRLALGLPDGTRDMLPGKSILLEAGFDELGGIAWDKGCYMGQELTARTRYRGLIKKRLMQVARAGGLPEAGTILADASGAEAGEMRSSQGDHGLALLRLEARGGPVFDAAGAGAPILARLPDWAVLPPERQAAVS